MQVKQVADNLGISEHTIRYYDKAGLFHLFREIRMVIEIFQKKTYIGLNL